MYLWTLHGWVKYTMKSWSAWPAGVGSQNITFDQEKQIDKGWNQAKKSSTTFVLHGTVWNRAPIPPRSIAFCSIPELNLMLFPSHQEKRFMQDTSRPVSNPKALNIQKGTLPITMQIISAVSHKKAHLKQQQFNRVITRRTSGYICFLSDIAIANHA